jgi:hypothetical protein
MSGEPERPGDGDCQPVAEAGLRAAAEPLVRFRQDLAPAGGSTESSTNTSGNTCDTRERPSRKDASIEELRRRLENPEAILTRVDLTTLGYSRRAVDAIVRECRRREGVLLLPGYSKPMVRVGVYSDVIADCTYGEDRVRPT